ncbi:adenosylcobinamide-phosphate synthase CbiB [Cytobacillus kochii]|uniref:adenosylcobinamide-phosphate synthase CbiB n=1 Tax=Cytobacillus kochii TaxID=859143 RepID=UPI001CD4607F|nr:adenosylcobinamide-phosphate synthase CbiB [Cytobacillus kochii]MCA1027946.1 adenosylcobinamide-phosphate synthase CbiB [Cytobacillus kochii]MCM3323857.1 adenosylcobinamide-phosphate synthase CbiB [Cytobacillus kochii]MCM3346254.1 adenosylcobinamide-phosphate synthase CbiB [Cytobacillus kochii]
MMIEHLIALTVAVVIDRFIGDPPQWPHPVKWMGSLIGFLRKKWNIGEHRKWKGVAMLTTVLLIVLVISISIVVIAYAVHPIVGILFEAVLIATTIAQKSLKEAAIEVYEPLKKEQLSEARQKLSYIVGRDTDELDEAEIVRGTVETVAENTSDGITAPLFFALIGGAPFALVYRAINTCDSMVGYKNEKYIDFGWASAKLDDVVNWVPSRLTAFCMLLVNKPRFIQRKESFQLVMSDAKKHPSPNSGWGEAAVAYLLGVQLGGKNTYEGHVSYRATMGEANMPLSRNHIVEANTIITKTIPLYLFILWLGGVLIAMA